MSGMAQLTGAPAKLAARHAMGGKAVRGSRSTAASAPTKAKTTTRGAPLKCDAIFDQLKSGLGGIFKGDPGETSRRPALLRETLTTTQVPQARHAPTQS
mmetsp:Transcript_36960/g.91984  ORF Transcript_36960/g.91984 Transcript_36960/m.91984 type:complete len:99 (-) Transcript_36960:226-522(-)